MKKNCLNQLDNALKLLFENAVNKGFFSGAAVGVYWKERQGEKRYIQTFGKTRKDSAGEKVTPQTIPLKILLPATIKYLYPAFHGLQ